jgi:hypothetical protein
MRGADEQPGSMFSYVSLEERVPRNIRCGRFTQITGRALKRLSPRFGRMYVNFGRPSIPPRRPLRALLLQALYTDSQRAAADGAARLQPAVSLVRGASVSMTGVGPRPFTKNRDRLLAGDVAAAFFRGGTRAATTARLLSTITSLSTARCWRPGRATKFPPRDEEEAAGERGGNPAVDFHGSAAPRPRIARPPRSWTRAL